MTKTYDYIRYDEISKDKQETAKQMFEEIEKFIQAKLLPGRAQSLALTKLEEAYMWVGKSVRDDQIQRNVQIEHIPERGE